MHRFSPGTEALINWLSFLLALAWLALWAPDTSAQCLVNGGNNMTITAGGPVGPLAAGDTVRAYSPRGTCVGEAVVPSSGGLALAIAGDDQFTPEIDGMQPGEAWTLLRHGPNEAPLVATYTNSITGEPAGGTYQSDLILEVATVAIAQGGAVSWPADVITVPDTVWSVQLLGWAAGDTPIGLVDAELAGAIDSVRVENAVASHWAPLGSGVQLVGMAGAVGGAGYLDDTTTVATVYGSTTGPADLTITRVDLVYATGLGAEAPAETPIGTITVTPSVPGDLTGDFALDAADYMLGIEYMLGLEDLTEAQRSRGDLTGDGEFDRRDVWLIFWNVRRSTP